jgi:hypothetical protein
MDTVDPADRRAFIEANAVSLVDARDAQIARQRSEFAALEAEMRLHPGGLLERIVARTFARLKAGRS